MPVKLLRTVKIVFGTLMLFFFFRITFLLFLRDYDRFLHYFVNLAHHPSGYGDLINNPIIAVSFQLLRIIFCYLTFNTGYRLYNFIFCKEDLLFPRAKDRITTNIAQCIYGNIAYVKSIGKAYTFLLTSLLVIQLIVFGYMICTLPYHYDEAFSHMRFASEGALTSMTYYPVPNNHVFFNVIASYFLWLPIDDIVALRLPSLIFSLLSTYYFFKIAHKLLSRPAAFLSTILFSFSYVFCLYSTQGRGYSMLIFFALCSIYSLLCIMQGGSLKKYMSVYAIASILGFLTMPSYLYCCVFVSLFMFFYYLIGYRTGLKRFFITHVIILVSTILLYFTIVALNGINTLTQTNGVAKQYDINYIKANAVEHFKEVWSYLIGWQEIHIWWVLALLLICAFVQFDTRRKRFQKNIYLLSLILILSPLPILFVHKTIPFPRTWSYLIIPIFLCVGTIFQEIAKLVVKRPFYSPAVLCGAMLIICAIMSGRFNAAHKRGYQIDYVVNSYNKILNDKYNRIRTIAQYGGGLTFYLSENMEFEVYRRNDEVSRLNTTTAIGDSTIYDIIVVDKNAEFAPLPEKYDYVNVENSYFNVWMRKDL
jgi:uncharacterized membrane protein